MKFPSFPKKPAVSKEAAKSAAPVAPKAVPKAKPVAAESPAGKKQIIFGLILIAASFLGAIFMLYLVVNAQNEKEAQLRDMKQDLVLVRTEKDLADTKMQKLEGEIGKVMDLDKVVETSQKKHGASEGDRKQGSMWINRKAKTCMVTLGVLNGISKGSRLAIFDGEEKVGTVNIVSALDVVSYAEPVDKELSDLKKDYYAIKVE